jgi:hypothetical protein
LSRGGLSRKVNDILEKIYRRVPTRKKFNISTTLLCAFSPIV